MTTNGRGGRIDRLERQWGMGGFCQNCHDGTLTRLVILYDDHVEELRPAVCPDCGQWARHTLPIDLRSDDDQEEWPA